MHIFDLHCDTASRIYYNNLSLASNDGHVDLEKLHKGNYVGQWFAYFVDVAEVSTPTLLEEVYAMDDYFRKQCEKYKDQIAIVSTYDAYQMAKKENKIAAFLSIEEGQVLEGKIENLEKLSELGVRMMTLTWNYANDLGFPHSSGTKGLTTFGKEVVSHLQGEKILLDISHLSKQGVLDAAKHYKGPIIASHCNAHHVFPHTRNIDDQVLGLVARSGGLIGVNFYNAFLGLGDKSRVMDIVAQIDYLYQLVGADCIALGTDFDGMNCPLEVCNCEKMDILVHKLLATYSYSTVEKMCYRNAERIIQENF